MLMTQTARPEVRTEGFEGTHDFTFEANAVMFDAMIRGIYSDKIRATVREYCTNAYDGHKRAGKADVPFDVQLPTEFEPIFRVRDYGVSLTRDQVLNLFTRIGASDKRGGNDEVGGIGVGCKSGFAYTDQFTVRCWVNGEMHVYICFIGPAGFPQCTIQKPIPSIEPDGVEVQFAVKRPDIPLFKAAAQYTFEGFDPKPNILNETFKLNYVSTLMEGPGWRVVQDNLGLRARQGCVIYPINASIVSPYEQSALWRLSMIIDFPVGSLTVATSREALGNDDRTKNNIKARMKEIGQDIVGSLQKRVDQEPDYLSACKLRINGLGKGYNDPETILWNTFGKDVKYKGEFLRSSFNLSHDLVDGFCYISQKTMQSDFPYPAFKNQPLKKFELSVQSYDDVVLVWEPPELKMPGTRMRTFILDNTDYKNILWVRGDKQQFTEFHESLHEPAWVDLSTIEPTKQTKAQRAAGRKLPTTAWVAYESYPISADTLDPSIGGVYIDKVDRTTFTVMGQSMGHHSVRRHMARLREADVFPGKIWCFTKLHTKVKALSNWEPFEEKVKRELKAQLNCQAYLAQQSIQELPSDDVICFMQKCQRRGVKLPAIMTNLLASLEKEMKKVQPPSSALLNVYRIYFPNELEQLQVKASPLLADLVAIKTKWPLLNALGHYYGDIENDLVEHYINLIP